MSLRKLNMLPGKFVASMSRALKHRGPFPEGLTSPLSFKALVLEHWCRRMGAQARVPDSAAVSRESVRECLGGVG